MKLRLAKASQLSWSWAWLSLAKFYNFNPIYFYIISGKISGTKNQSYLAKPEMLFLVSLVLAYSSQLVLGLEVVLPEWRPRVREIRGARRSGIALEGRLVKFNLRRKFILEISSLI